ncbi:hypothetical protein VC83_00221 [Pseudogymnoascus destructans]|uniref:Uncharacterized protein n=2 Tax=Pseudogymnoascus destructans TaxID=655981 RepID=L8GCL8_PSED2|nr:uncharacterized protein VC83_00221 [Pseudogymnoascus destructans]ELR10569.1 hypothetical protein GMDG_04842 [Pseudogymnoascus destructans 20631-21]OAF62897.1 hypothetical protein VC83_00221 [Pseudogymnoascus destructans]
MVYSLAYRRPAYVEPEIYASRQSGSEKDAKEESVRSGRSGKNSGIPAALAFDKIVDGGTCAPCTLRDFMDYMLYVEHSAENLKFYLWLHDYTERFNNLTESSKMLSPQYIYVSPERTSLVTMPLPAVPKRQSFTNEVFKGTVFDNDPFRTPCSSDSDLTDRPAIFSLPWSNVRIPGRKTPSPTKPNRTLAISAFAKTGMRPPFSTQPFRTEISRVISTYLLPSSPHELNLSSRDRAALLAALERTTHPSAFIRARAAIDDSLHNQSHPNFVRWAIANGNPPRISFAWWGGIALLFFGTLIAMLLTLSRAPRGYRILAAIPWVIGAATFGAAREGLCVCLHAMRARQVRPWELFGDSEAEVEMGKAELDGMSITTSGLSVMMGVGDAPWVGRYKKRGLLRRVFERQVRVVEPALREVQNTLFVQAALVAVLGTAVATGVFVAMPSGNFF